MVSLWREACRAGHTGGANRARASPGLGYASRACRDMAGQEFQPHKAPSPPSWAHSAQGSNKRKGVIIQGGNWASTGSRCQDSKDTHPRPASKSPQQRSHKWKFACPVISGTSSAPYQQRMSAAGHMEGLLTLECARPACRDRKKHAKPSLTLPSPLVLPSPNGVQPDRAWARCFPSDLGSPLQDLHT